MVLILGSKGLHQVIKFHEAKKLLLFLDLLASFRATLMNPGKDETHVCGYIYIYIYIYMYIYIRDINNNQLLPLHSVSWVEPNLKIAVRYIYKTIFICSKNKNT